MLEEDQNWTSTHCSDTAVTVIRFHGFISHAGWAPSKNFASRTDPGSKIQWHGTCNSTGGDVSKPNSVLISSKNHIE